MNDVCLSVSTATFTILPEPGTGRVALLCDGVELATFGTQAEAFAFGAGYVALSVSGRCKCAGTLSERQVTRQSAPQFLQR
jgi:hypothetical protein